MKYTSKSQFAFSNRSLLISLFFAFLSASLALVGLGAISKGNGDTKQSMSSPQTTAAFTASTQLHSKNTTLTDNPYRYLDQKGNRASGFKPAPAVRAKHHESESVFVIVERCRCLRCVDGYPDWVCSKRRRNEHVEAR